MRNVCEPVRLHVSRLSILDSLTSIHQSIHRMKTYRLSVVRGFVVEWWNEMKVNEVKRNETKRSEANVRTDQPAGLWILRVFGCSFRSGLRISDFGLRNLIRNSEFGFGLWGSFVRSVGWSVGRSVGRFVLSFVLSKSLSSSLSLLLSLSLSLSLSF